MNANEKRMAKHIAKVMREARREKGLTQADIARLLDTTQANISKIEQGVLIPSALDWFLFCEVTGISPESIRKTPADPTSDTEN